LAANSELTQALNDLRNALPSSTAKLFAVKKALENLEIVTSRMSVTEIERSTLCADKRRNEIFIWDIRGQAGRRFEAGMS
jgi:hypothetical protein